VGQRHFGCELTMEQAASMALESKVDTEVVTEQAIGLATSLVRCDDPDLFDDICPHFDLTAPSCQLLQAACFELLEESTNSGRPMVLNHVAKIIARAFYRVSNLQAANVVRHLYQDDGLLANCVSVVDTLAYCAPGTGIRIDWARNKSTRPPNVAEDWTTQHFQYGPAEENLFETLFEPIVTDLGDLTKGSYGAPEKVLYETRGLVLPHFINLVRGYFWTTRYLPELRAMYCKAASRLRLRPRVERVVEKTLSAARGAHFLLGVHRRVATSDVSQVQLTLRMPLTKEFIEAARVRLVDAGGPEDCVVFLATDDSCAPAAFEDAVSVGGPLYGARLICRTGVRRVEGGMRPDGISNEVHRIPSSVQDAVDALADCICLSHCDMLLHIDSSVAIFAAIWNPELLLCKVGGPISPDCPIRHGKPQYFKVVHYPFVFVRLEPTVASGTNGELPYGKIFKSSGRSCGAFIEVEDGGWVMLDGSELNLGQLLEPNEGTTQQ